MEIFHSLPDLRQALRLDPRPSVASIGNFDGVHCGHRWVIEKVSERARALGGRSLLITFDPHPVRLLRPEAAHALITPLPVKLDLLRQTAVDAVLVLPFTVELAALSPEAFAREILSESCQVREIYEGANFRFGARGAGDMETLAELGQTLGFAALRLEPLMLRGGPVSSSRIRTLLSAGQVSQARGLLGRPFALRSKPARGRGYGSRYTVPTINLAEYSELLPGNGVYVTTMRVGSGDCAEVFQGVTNIGTRPTFDAEFPDSPVSVETHLLNFHPIALDEETPLELTFLMRLRPEMRWPTTEALRAQIGKDVARARRYFALSGR